MQYKKSVILLVSVILLTVSFIIFIYKNPEFFKALNQILKNDHLESMNSFLDNENQKKAQILNQTNLLSPCRTVSQNSVVKPKLNRAQKLNRLMDVSIDWSFKNLSGELIDLYCLRDQKRIVINFWATWCPPCIKELSSLSQLAKENKDKIFVVAISTEDKIKVQNFLKQSFSDLDSLFKIAVVSEEEKLAYFPEDNLPVTYIFNTKGFLEFKVVGDKNWSDKNIVQSILKLD
ncbi:MAG: TlpA disulfide reductase family protein [Bdellovibrionaceae bacterium]|nr:TlpA disulfide reductase family protein [Pseudobdellovibrionaceae bacterium]